MEEMRCVRPKSNMVQDDYGGLHVEDPCKPGHFIDVTLLLGSLMMNVGDLLMR
jgi:isopenicillin N synthase-like dioxygenase